MDASDTRDAAGERDVPHDQSEPNAINARGSVAALERLGKAINHAVRGAQPGDLREAILEGERLRYRVREPGNLAQLDYFLANAWAGLRESRHSEPSLAWAWEQPELEQEITHLRRATLVVDTGALPREGACRILTNLGNCLDTVGRHIEAIATYDQALHRDPQFGMAVGNRAMALVAYGRALYDSNDAALFYGEALTGLTHLPDNVEEHAQERFALVRHDLQSRTGTSPTRRRSRPRRPRQEDTSQEDVAYRIWCHRHRLFLDPLNDLGDRRRSRGDWLLPHGFIVAIGSGPGYHGFINQMKQEYASARYVFYRSQQGNLPHYSDRGVRLLNTMDYPAYGLSVEEPKMAFRTAYAIFDKVAFFINMYFELGHKPTQVSFKNVWYDRRDRAHGLMEAFRDRRNLPLRALFWVSKDLFEEDPQFRNAIDPTMREVKEVRDHLEHKYLKLHDMGPFAIGDSSVARGLADTLAYSVNRDHFSDVTLSVLSLVRSSLIYLLLALAREEHARRAQRDSSQIVPSIALDSYEDAWKR